MFISLLLKNITWYGCKSLLLLDTIQFVTCSWLAHILQEPFCFFIMVWGNVKWLSTIRVLSIYVASRQRRRQTRQRFFTLPKSPAGDVLSIIGNVAMLAKPVLPVKRKTPKDKVTMKNNFFTIILFL